MLNIFPVDESYRNSYIKKIYNIEMSNTENEVYSRYNMNIEEKAKQDASIIKNMILESESLKKAIKDIEERYEYLLENIEKAKSDLKIMLQTSGITNIKTPYIEVKISKNPHSTNIYSEREIPEEYIKETIVKSINKKQLLDDLKQGVIIPGVEIQQKTRIDIK